MTANAYDTRFFCYFVASLAGRDAVNVGYVRKLVLVYYHEAERMVLSYTFHYCREKKVNMLQ
jgi:hypothetical protein